MGTETVTSNGDVTRITTDAQVAEAYRAAYHKAPLAMQPIGPSLARAGVNRVVRHKGKGNVDVYLSKRTLNLIRSFAIGTGVGIVGSMTGGSWVCFNRSHSCWSNDWSRCAKLWFWTCFQSSRL